MRLMCSVGSTNFHGFPVHGSRGVVKIREFPQGNLCRAKIAIYINVAVVTSDSKPADYDWDQHLASCLAEAENFQPPSEIFTVR